jgi:hypothetical protein
MDTSENSPSIRSLHILKIVLYILAGLVLAAGLLVGISLLISSSSVSNMLLPLTIMGAAAAANLIAPLLTSLLSGMGVFILVITLVLSLLLFTAGRLVGRIASLEVRLGRMEARAAISN